MRNLNIGRKIDLDALNLAINKVTVGFKCDPETKLKLILEAEKEGVSLSSYIEGIILRRELELFTNEEVNQILDEMNEELNFYEHPKLQKALTMYRGKEISFTNEDGQVETITVRGLHDVFTVFINYIKLT
jgi:hypothetical protein